MNESLGGDLGTKHARLIERELVYVDVVALGPVHVLTMDDVLVAGKRGIRSRQPRVAHDGRGGQIKRMPHAQQLADALHDGAEISAAWLALAPVFGIVHHRQIALARG